MVIDVLMISRLKTFKTLGNIEINQTLANIKIEMILWISQNSNTSFVIPPGEQNISKSLISSQVL